MANPDFLSLPSQQPLFIDWAWHKRPIRSKLLWTQSNKGPGKQKKGVVESMDKDKGFPPAYSVVER